MTFRLLDHFRGAAALAVVFLHVFAAIEPDPTRTHGSLLAAQEITRFGCLGVDLFFVISGFCISNYTMRMVARHARTRDFVRDRLLRIYPTFWAAYALAIVLAFGSALARGGHLDAEAVHPLPQVVANLLLVDTYFGYPPALDVTWTLIFEVAFYLFAASGFLLYRQGCPPWLLALVGGAAVALGFVGFHAGPFRILEMLPEFACGVIVFVMLAYTRDSLGKQVALWVALVALPLASWLFYPPDAVPLSTTPGKFPIHTGPDAISWRITSAALFATLLILVHPMDERWSKVSWLRWLGRVGAFSYSLYLIHIVLAGRAVNLVKRLFPEPSWTQWFQPVAGVAASVLGGWLLYRLAEVPAERWRRAIAQPGGAKPVLAAAQQDASNR